VGRGGGGLDQGGNPGQESGGELLQKPPDGKVEGVHLEGDPALGPEDVPPLEGEVLGKGEVVLLGEEVALGEGAGEAGVSVEDPDAPVHVVPSVPPRAPGGGVEPIEDLLALGKVLGQGPKPPSPLLEA